MWDAVIFQVLSVTVTFRGTLHCKDASIFHYQMLTRHGEADMSYFKVVTASYVLLTYQ